MSLNKLSFFIVYCLLVGCSDIKTDEVIIHGEFKDAQTDTVYLYFSDSTGNRVTHKAVLLDDQFDFTLNTDQVVRAGIVIQDPSLGIPSDLGYVPAPMLNLYLEPGTNIEIKGQYEKYGSSTVSGGIENSVLNELKALRQPFEERNWNLLIEYYGTDDMMEKEGFSSDMTKARNAIDSVNRVYFNVNSDNHEYALFVYSSSYMMTDPSKLDSLIQGMGPKARDSEYGRLLKIRMDALIASGIGSMAPDFEKNLPDGTPFQLSSLKGKYVLIDFWGSWCRPCRISHPKLRELYDEYKGDEFEIVGVSQEGGRLESAKKNWLKAIEEDEITWIQVLNDENANELDVVDLYGVNAFPTQVLLDKEGKVMLRSIGTDGNVMENKIIELLGDGQ